MVLYSKYEHRSATSYHQNHSNPQQKYISRLGLSEHRHTTTVVMPTDMTVAVLVTVLETVMTLGVCIISAAYTKPVVWCFGDKRCLYSLT